MPGESGSLPMMGPFGGPQCSMSNLRKGHVSMFCKILVDLKKSPMLHVRFKKHVMSLFLPVAGSIMSHVHF